MFVRFFAACVAPETVRSQNASNRGLTRKEIVEGATPSFNQQGYERSPLSGSGWCSRRHVGTTPPRHRAESFASLRDGLFIFLPTDARKTFTDTRFGRTQSRGFQGFLLDKPRDKQLNARMNGFVTILYINVTRRARPVHRTLERPPHECRNPSKQV